MIHHDELPYVLSLNLDSLREYKVFTSICNFPQHFLDTLKTDQLKIPWNFNHFIWEKDFPGGSDGKASTMWEIQVRSLGWEDPLKKAMATHSSTLAWKIPWTEEPGRLQSMGSQRVGPE